MASCSAAINAATEDSWTTLVSLSLITTAASAAIVNATTTAHHSSAYTPSLSLLSSRKQLSVDIDTHSSIDEDLKKTRPKTEKKGPERRGDLSDANLRDEQFFGRRCTKKKEKCSVQSLGLHVNYVQ
jgi:hypothetical protein